MSDIPEKFTKDQIITALYKGILLREPDQEGMAFYMNRIHSEDDIQLIIKAFLKSDEFRLGANRPTRPMNIDLDISPEELEKIWNHICEVWSDYGEKDAYWSVLIQEKYRQSNIEQQKNLDDFYCTGNRDISIFKRLLERNNIRTDKEWICAEYGCGVGRLTIPLAREFRKVIGFDISQPHIDIAKERAIQENIQNIDLVSVQSRKDLEHLTGIDLFFSLIVLQHNPAPIQADILSRAFHGLRPGGIAYFQVATYRQDYTFSSENYWKEVAPGKIMEVHAIPQQKIFELAKESGLTPIEVLDDSSVENMKFESKKFILQKI